MHKTKGFTLIEVIVAIACSTILIGGITGCYILMSRLNNEVIDSSANLYKIASVRDYIVTNPDSLSFSAGVSPFIISDDGDVFVTVTENEKSVEKKIASDTKITNIYFETKDDLLFCSIEYNDRANTYTFATFGSL